MRDQNADQLELNDKKLRPIKNHIIFKFLDEVRNGFFVNQFGYEHIIVPYGNRDDTTQDGRLVEILAVGPDVDERIQVGSIVALEALMWTEGVDFEGQNIWRTDDEQVMMICDSDEPAEESA